MSEKKVKKQKNGGTLLELVRGYFGQREKGKRAYARADELLSAISKEIEPGSKVLDESGQPIAVFVDQFADRTTVYKPCGVKRFDLKEVAR